MLAGLPEPDAGAIEQRFAALKAERWPQVEAPDDAIRAALARELKIADHRAERALDLRGARRQDGRHVQERRCRPAG
jgi:hypothetical protein